LLSAIYGGEIKQLEDGRKIDFSLRNRKKAQDIQELLNEVIVPQEGEDIERLIDERKSSIIVDVARKSNNVIKEKEGSISFVIKNSKINKTSSEL